MEMAFKWVILVVQVLMIAIYLLMSYGPEWIKRRLTIVIEPYYEKKMRKAREARTERLGVKVEAHKVRLGVKISKRPF
jgi:hypothetical protein